MYTFVQMKYDAYSKKKEKKSCIVYFGFLKELCEYIISYKIDHRHA